MVHIFHTHCIRQQREYIKDLRSQSTDKSFVVAQIDFSMNYTLIRQREVQQGFFSQHQVTLFTIHFTIGSEQRNLAIISNYRTHISICLLRTKNFRRIHEEELSTDKKDQLSQVSLTLVRYRKLLEVHVRCQLSSLF